MVGNMELILFCFKLFLLLRYVSAISNESFPEGFMFGVSTAAYQIEGGWSEDNKGESIWDHYVHQKINPVLDNNTGDVACDSYHKYKEDVRLLADMGLTHYRFSLSWPRILPSGFDNDINHKGIEYYKDLLEELAKYNITPVVTIYHWDLPESIQDIGGWLSPKIVDYFVDYAKIVFQHFGDCVNYWITVNEPKQVCTSGYGKGSMAPGIALDGEADYICAYNVLKAHAAVYHLYKEYGLNGSITIAIDGSWSEPISSSEEDQAAAKRRLEFEFGLYANPVFKSNWPKVVIDRIAERSKKENFTISRLPEFTADEIKTISGTTDFMALNFYEARLVGDAEEAEYGTPGVAKDIRVNVTKDPSWAEGSNGNAITPWGFRKFLKWVKNNYNNPEILITENGVGDDGSSLYDAVRVYFLADYLSSLLGAIHEDGVNVFGYTHWSLMDNFEWRHGFIPHFGLYSVDFTDDNRTRTAKLSADYYRQIATTLKIPDVQLTTTETPNSSYETSPQPTTREITTTSAPDTTTKKPGAACHIAENVYLIILSLLLLMNQMINV